MFSHVYGDKFLDTNRHDTTPIEDSTGVVE